MRYWVHGVEASSKRPRDPLFLEAENEDAARAQATAQGMQVEEIEAVQPRSSAAVPVAPPSGDEHSFVPFFRRSVPGIVVGVVLGSILVLLLQYLTRPAPYEQFKAISDGKRAQLSQFLASKGSELSSYTATVTEETDVDKRAEATHVGVIEFSYTVTQPKGEFKEQLLHTASAEYRFLNKWVYKGCSLKQGGGFPEPKELLVKFSEVKEAFEK